MLLKNLNNEELITSTRNSLKMASEAEVNVLRHFQEIEERRLWTGMGSLYKYIERTFDLTADQISPRLQAMRLMRAVPEVEQQLEDGKLSVTNALKAQQVFTAESKERPVSLEEKREVLESLSNTSTKEADQILAEKYPDSKKPAEKIKPVAKNQNLLQFYVDDETLKQIEELKAKFSHQMPSGQMGDLMKILIQKANHRPKPRRRLATQTVNEQPKPRKKIVVRTRSRYISAEVKREMEKTRHFGCSHTDPATKDRCSSVHFLQMDHVKEYSRGGSNEAENLRWLCGFHNRFRFETSRGVSSKNLETDRSAKAPPP